MVIVNLQLSVKPEQLTAMKTRFASEVLPDTKNYSGCSALYMTENIDVPNQVEFVSIWETILQMGQKQLAFSLAHGRKLVLIRGR